MNKINLNKAYYFCPVAVDMCTDETQTSHRLKIPINVTFFLCTEIRTRQYPEKHSMIFHLRTLIKIPPSIVRH